MQLAVSIEYASNARTGKTRVTGNPIDGGVRSTADGRCKILQKIFPFDVITHLSGTMTISTGKRAPERRGHNEATSSKKLQAFAHKGSL